MREPISHAPTSYPGTVQCSTIFSIHISVVVRRNGNGDLELSGQVGRSVKGLEVLNGVTSDLSLLVVVVSKPDLVVGTG